MTTNMMGQSLGSQIAGMGADSGFDRVPTRISSAPSGTLTADTPIPEVVERLERLEEHLGSVHRVCGEAWASQGSYEKALLHQRAAVDCAPDNLEYRNQLGFLRYLTGDDGAAVDFEFVLAQAPDNADAWFNLAMLRYGSGDHLAAEQAFRRATEIKPDDAETWNNLGVVLHDLGRLTDATFCFQRAIQIDPENEDARANLDTR